MAISEEERNRRLNENYGLIRERIKSAGVNVLVKAITAPGPITPTKAIKDQWKQDLGDIRFIADCLLDQNGDVVDPQVRINHYNERGIFLEGIDDFALTEDNQDSHDPLDDIVCPVDSIALKDI